MEKLKAREMIAFNICDYENVVRYDVIVDGKQISASDKFSASEPLPPPDITERCLNALRQKMIGAVDIATPPFVVGFTKSRLVEFSL